MEPWIGVDLDGTLAVYPPPQGKHIGPIVPKMEARIRQWLLQGVSVKIMTARAEQPDEVAAIHAWLHENNLPSFEVTNKKDYAMLELWDDRARQVVPNTGVLVERAPYTVTDRRRVS
jgi:hypothetical protein